MSLENVTADASLERNDYHKLELDQLEKLDDAEALYQRGDRTLNGIVAEKNEDLGWHLIIEAARRGHAVALGNCFLHGRGAERNEARAVELFRASADRGHASAQYYLGDSYGDSRDENDEGIRFLRAAALQDYTPAQFRLGECYRDGAHGVETNKLRAACLLRSAAEKGDQQAKNCIDELELEEVIARCVFAIDIVQQHIAIVDSLRGVVIELLRRDEQPLESVTSDTSVERDNYDKLSLKELEKIADAEALFEIGHRIMWEINIAKDEQLVKAFMLESARRGHPVGLALSLIDGEGEEKARGTEMLRASADRGREIGIALHHHSDSLHNEIKTQCC
jgi:hypothetical protein